MALDVVEGKLRPTDIRRRVREYVTAQFRLFSKYGPASLDGRLSEDGNAPLLDRLSTDVGTGYWDVNDGIDWPAEMTTRRRAPKGDGFLSKSGAACPWVSEPGPK
jgi:hypothetical protein